MYRVVAIAFSAFALVNSALASPPPTPEGNGASESSRAKVIQENKKSEARQAYTEKLSTSINELSAAIRDSKTNVPGKYEEEKIEIERKSLQAEKKVADQTENLATYTDRLASMTTLLVIVGAVQIGIFVWQLILMTKATIAAGKSAQAALETAKFTTAAERAYVFTKVDIAKTKIINADGKEFASVAAAVFPNHGKTPATITYMSGARYLSEEVPQQLLTALHLRPELPDGLIIASEGGYNLPIPLELSSADIQEIENGVKRLCCAGLIKYRDVFEKNHETGFCWEYIRTQRRFKFCYESKLNYYT